MIVPLATDNQVSVTLHHVSHRVSKQDVGVVHCKTITVLEVILHTWHTLLQHKRKHALALRVMAQHGNSFFIGWIHIQLEREKCFPVFVLHNQTAQVSSQTLSLIHELRFVRVDFLVDFPCIRQRFLSVRLLTLRSNGQHLVLIYVIQFLHRTLINQDFRDSTGGPRAVVLDTWGKT